MDTGTLTLLSTSQSITIVSGALTGFPKLNALGAFWPGVLVRFPYITQIYCQMDLYYHHHLSDCSLGLAPLPMH